MSDDEREWTELYAWDEFEEPPVESTDDTLELDMQAFWDGEDFLQPPFNESGYPVTPENPV